MGKFLVRMEVCSKSSYGWTKSKLESIQNSTFEGYNTCNNIDYNLCYSDCKIKKA